MGEAEGLFVSVRQRDACSYGCEDAVSRIFLAKTSICSDKPIHAEWSFSFYYCSAIAAQSAMKIHGFRFTIKSSKNEKSSQHAHMAS